MRDQRTVRDADARGGFWPAWDKRVRLGRTGDGKPERSAVGPLLVIGEQGNACNLLPVCRQPSTCLCTNRRVSLVHTGIAGRALCSVIILVAYCTHRCWTTTRSDGEPTMARAFSRILQSCSILGRKRSGMLWLFLSQNEMFRFCVWLIFWPGNRSSLCRKWIHPDFGSCWIPTYSIIQSGEIIRFYIAS